MKCLKCDWIKKGKYEVCAQCSNRFPCKEECSHLDCHFEKARKCHICGKRVSNSLRTYFFVDGKGVRSYLVHKECIGEEYAYCVTIE